MQSFEYTAPTSVQEALGLLAPSWGNADILAGGTDLLSLMKQMIHTPRRVVSLKKIPALRGVAKSGGGLRIGAMTTLNELLADAEVRKQYPGLVQAAQGIRSPQMRSMGTVGGELLQRPRCWYFRNGFGLLAQDESGKALVPNGENEYHAILGNKGPAYFVSASSLAPALIALGAKVKIASGSGERVKERDVRSAAAQVDGLAAHRGVSGANDERWLRAERPRGAGARGADPMAFGRSGTGAYGEGHQRTSGR
jgi:xanthine dehydrogenase YagS FAD-binding subunit